MEVDKKLSMSLEDLIKKTKQSPAAKKSFIKKAFTGEKQKPPHAKVRGGNRKDRVQHHASKPSTSKLGIRKPLGKKERRSDDDPMTGSRKKVTVRRVSVPSGSAAARSSFSRKVVIKKGPNAPGEQRKVKVQNVPYDLTWKDVKAAMSEVGKIDRCDVEHGEAMVTFASHKEALRAVQMYNGGDMNGRKIRVSLATTTA